MCRMGSRALRARQCPTPRRLDGSRRPRVVSPVVLPYHSLTLSGRINRLLLSRQLGRQISSMPSPRLLWTYNPLVIDLLDMARFATVIYHCVDDLATMPRVSTRAISRTEPRLVHAADAVFATSAHKADQLRPFNPEGVHLVHNVADAAHFGRALEPGPLPPDIAAIARPRALFIGSMNDYKVDWPLLGRAAALRPDWQFVLIGPVGGEERITGLREIRGCPNVHLLGQRPYATLPAYLRGADAGLIPYRVTPHTSAVFPLKTWEYLAAGVHVVATDLPALRGIQLPLAIAHSADEFANALDATQEHAVEHRVHVASQWTWDRLLERIFSQLQPPPPTHLPDS
jgi:glycosyltransferase involved in cell wall biosynthesis